jgi:hypothetical protein
MVEILTLGKYPNYNLILPNLSDIQTYTSKTNLGHITEELYWENLLESLRPTSKPKYGENIFSALEFIPFGTGHDVSIKDQKNIPSLVNQFFKEAERYGMRKDANYILVQDLMLKTAFIGNPCFSGKAQLLIHQ